MLVRDIPFTLDALEETIFVTCSDIMSTAGSTAAVGIRGSKTTASAIVESTDILGTTGFGRIINRLRQPIGTQYDACVVGAWLHSTRGSTEANRKITIGVKLQHGDSSGGGDMADYSTGSQPANRNYFSSARSTDHRSWDATESTGEVYAASNPGVYDLRGAKQYIRVAVPIIKLGVTTESSGDEQSRLGATITFASGQYLPQAADVSSPYSTSTST